MSDMEVWTPLVDTNWLQHVETTPVLVETDEVKAIRARILQHMGSFAQGHNLTALFGCGASLGDSKATYTGPSMSDLLNVASTAIKFSEAKAICGHKSDPANIEDFLSDCERMKLSPSSGPQGLTEVQIGDLEAFLADAKKKIRMRCDFLDGELPKGKTRFPLESHKKFLRCFAHRSGRKPRLQLFTTNYDLCFETAASETSFVVLDGFSFSFPRRFSSLHYELEIAQRKGQNSDSLDPIDNIFRLFKLHGSVNWDLQEGSVVLENNPENPCLIHPANTKYQQAFEQPYLEMLSHYLEALRQTDQTLLVIGFGFADVHLTAPIQSALESSNKFRLVVVDPCLKEKLGKKEGFYGTLGRWMEENDERLTLVNGTFAQFMSLVPRFHKPSDAERLAEAVQRIARQTIVGHAA